MVRHLIQSGRSLGVTEIAHQMALPKSSVFRILRVLVELGFVQKSPVSGRYSVSPKIFSFVYELAHQFGPNSRCEPFLRECAERWNCSIYLCVLSGTHSYVVLASGSSGSTFALGSHCPIYASSAGKIILAQYPESEWEEYAPREGECPLTAHTNLDRDKFFKELHVAKEQGVAWNVRESTASDVSVAAFVPEVDHSPRMAVALLVPYKDVLVHDREVLASRVRELAKRVAAETKSAPPAHFAVFTKPAAAVRRTG